MPRPKVAAYRLLSGPSITWLTTVMARAERVQLGEPLRRPSSVVSTMPTSVPRSPRPKEPPGLHEPHQPAHTVWSRLAIAVIECPAPESATFFQSAPLVLAHVLVFTQTYWPPATQVF